MKNKKKTTPFVETVKNEGPLTSKEAKTVGGFKKLLGEFPDDCEFILNGDVEVKGIEVDGKPNGSIIISQINNGHYPVSEECNSNGLEDTEEFTENMDKRDYEDEVMDKHLFGLGYKNDLFSNQIREVNAEFLTEAPIMMPNREELNLEKTLMPNQNMTLDEIRYHNAYVAECMGELHRREIAALLEYQTQCMAHFGIQTNRCMCEIVLDHEDDIINTITDIIKGE